MTEENIPLNRAQRRAAGKELQAQLAKGGVDLSQQPAPPTKVLVAWMYNDNYAKPTGSWVQSLWATAAKGPSLGFTIAQVPCDTGPELSKARDLLLRQFLGNEPYEYLLFSDTDIVFTPEDVKLLLDAKAAIAGALYFTAAPGFESRPVALGKEVDEDGSVSYRPITLPEPPEGFEEWEEDAIREWIAAATVNRPVATTGMGLTLISRECAQTVADAFPRPFEYQDGLSEDLTFCLRAAELGFETTLVPAARVGHIKAVVL